MERSKTTDFIYLFLFLFRNEDFSDKCLKQKISCNLDRAEMFFDSFSSFLFFAFLSVPFPQNDGTKFPLFGGCGSD